MRQGKKAVQEVDKPSANWRLDVRISLVLSALLAASALAGCLDLGAGVSTSATEDSAPLLAAEQTATWDGWLLVGAANELPAHFPETAGPVRAMWNGMATFMVEDVPRSVVFEFEWTGAPGSTVLTMVESPEVDGEVKYWALDWTSSDHFLCIPVPAEELTTGAWKPMLHSRYGAEIEFTITARMVGGSGRFVDGHDTWMPFAEWVKAAYLEDRFNGFPADPCP